MALKGIPRRSISNNIFNFETFKNVLFGVTDASQYSVNVNYFRYNKTLTTIVTKSETKKPLSLVDNKRFYFNHFDSVAYGNPRCFNKDGESLEKIGDILSIRGGFIQGTKHLIMNESDESQFQDKSEGELDDQDDFDPLLELVNLIEKDESVNEPPLKKRKLDSTKMTTVEKAIFERISEADDGFLIAKK